MNEPTDFIAEAITEAFGKRCPDYAEGCPCCDAWKQYDDLRALGTQPVPVAVKPYAHEYGKSNGDGTYSVFIERGEPKNPVPDWPVKPLFASPPKPDKGVVEALREAPISRLMTDTGKPEWQQINDMFLRHGINAFSIRLRDELVTMLVWARYGEAIAARLSSGRTEE